MHLTSVRHAKGVIDLAEKTTRATAERSVDLFVVVLSDKTEIDSKNVHRHMRIISCSYVIWLKSNEQFKIYIYF